MSSSSQNAESWISLFCSLVGHEYFAEVSEDFIEDDFNLTGLQSQVSMYKEALEMILDVEPETDYSGEDDDEDDDEDPSELNSDDSKRRDEEWYRQRAEQRRAARVARDYSAIESSAEMLYGLIHQRFITSRQGIQQMLEKYEIGHFGTCPRVHCRGAKVLPVGCSDIPGQDTVKLFCPACLDVYAPPNSRFQTVDGAFFGTTFGCLFFMTFPELDVAGTRKADPPLNAGQQPEQQPQKTQQASEAINGVAAHNLAPGLGKGNIFEPRIYGFRVSELARTGPRMKWLRQKPERLDELDEVAIWEQSRPVEEMEQDAEEDVDVQDEEEGELEDEEEEDVADEEEDEQGVEGENVDDGSGRGKKARLRANGAPVGA
ncbi:hypothetical protein K461DRAFT_275083 [Myriangium duriaei CBS 260.36]|uniref:Casein kinase II subunit beta n=1 Tax=Myriangium duriaei CBS 260.36 TaxID=1168546 RepID=A0A9P4JAA4_9PEZI|nr:hypothetical protein K461DRAFT_275083 [Myriangium duriaei CBS 260.36]